MLTPREDEQRVLMCLLLKPTGLEQEAVARLNPASFEHPAHGRILDAMRTEGTSLDTATLVRALTRAGHLESVGGIGYISELLNAHGDPAHVDRYAEHVHENASRRRLASTVKLVTDRLTKGEGDPSVLARELRATLEPFAIECGDDLRPPVRAMDAVAGESVQMLVSDLLTCGDIALLVGDGGSFKSTVAVHLAGAIAGGYRAFDHFATQQHPALIVSAEDPEGVIRMRLEALVAGHGWNLDRVMANVHILADHDASISDARWRSHIQRHASRLGVGLVVFDPLADLIQGDENSNSELRPILRFARGLGAETGAVPAFVHHLGKAAEGKRMADRIRGASALGAASRSTLAFEYTDSGVKVEHLKMSRAPKLPPFMLQREITSNPESRVLWTSARLSYSTVRAVITDRAEQFVLAQVTASPRFFSSTSLRDEAKGSGISAQDVARAVASLQAQGRIDCEDAGRNKKLWFPVSLPSVLGKVA